MEPVENDTIITGNYEKYLRLMSRYLSYVVIIGLSYANWYQYRKGQELQFLYNEQKQEALRYWRDAYKESVKMYELIIQKQLSDVKQSEKK